MDREFERIKTIINKLKSTNSRIEKEEILKENSEDYLFSEVLKFIYDPRITTGLSNSKINKIVDCNPTNYFKNLIDAMNYLNTNNTGRDKDIANIQKYIQDNSLHRKLLIDIFTNNLRLGVTAKTINKVYGKIIDTFDVMLAKKFEDYEKKICGDFILTEKLDGHRAIALNDISGLKIFTRQGQQYEGLRDLEKELELMPKGYVYDGELIAVNDKKLTSKELFRKTTSIVRSDGIKKNVNYYIFDMLPITDFWEKECKIPCIDRKKELEKAFLLHEFKNLKPVKMLYVGNDKNKVIEFLELANFSGLEGIMLNLAYAAYECKRSSNILKCKTFNDADVLVVDVIEGQGKNADKLGSIKIKFAYENEYYECNCGSGFSDEERIKYWNSPELLLNKVVTIGYFEISENKDGSYGLRFPTWKGIIRADKTEISMY